MLINGKYGTANVFATLVDEETRKQIANLMEQKFIKGSKVSIMADCHAGAGCVIGTTIKITDCCAPSLVGVDIGCGMLTAKLGKMDIDLIKLDRFIRKKIPSGFEIRKEAIEADIDISKLHCYKHLNNKGNLNRALGSLGGGNHFIEIDRDNDGNLYLIIHTGSRNLGKQVCDYYVKLAESDFMEKYSKARNDLIKRYTKLNKTGKIEEGLERLRKRYLVADKNLIPLYKESFKSYIHDMHICQEFARINREAILVDIMKYLELDMNEYEYFHTVHNYINMNDMILRKGAISAYENEMVLIPINMRDGSILARGKSNSQYNFSAPHGAGRVLSRTQANQIITLDEFKEAMKGIYSTSVQIDTIDESPFAYKSIEDILPNILDTVEVVSIMKPIYNFKASNKRGR